MTNEITLNTPELINGYRLLVLASKLELEIKNIKFRGPTAYATIKREFGLKGSKEKVRYQFGKILEQAGIKQAK